MNNIKNELNGISSENVMNEKKWIRNCPECNKFITYLSKGALKTAIKDKKHCKSCSKKGDRNPIQKGFWSKEYKRNLSIRNKGNKNPFYGRKHSMETRKIISQKGMGRKYSNATIELWRKQRKGKLTAKMYKQLKELHKNQIGKPRSEETIKKLRLYRANWIKNNRGGAQYNPNACKFIDKLNEGKRWNLQHALNGGEYYIKELGYWVDGYDKDKNIVFEYDEPKHYDRNNKLRQKDIKRMEEIKFHLKCKFYRFNENRNMLYEA